MVDQVFQFLLPVGRFPSVVPVHVDPNLVRRVHSRPVCRCRNVRNACWIRLVVDFGRRQSPGAVALDVQGVRHAALTARRPTSIGKEFLKGGTRSGFIPQRVPSATTTGSAEPTRYRPRITSYPSCGPWNTEPSVDQPGFMVSPTAEILSVTAL